MIQKTAKTPFSVILGNHNPEEIGPLDRFLITELFDPLDRRLFSKGGLYRAIQGSVPRPEYLEAEIPASEWRLQHTVLSVVESLRQMLDRHRGVYIKNTSSTVGGGHGLIKMVVDGDNVRLHVPRSATRDYIEHSLDRLFSEGSEDFIRFSSHSYQEPDIIDIPIMKTRTNQPLERIFYTLVKHALEAGEYAIEVPIKIPLYHGRTWEMRNIIQCPNGMPQISARYVKVGAGKDFSNITLGGEPEDPKVVIAGVYQIHAKVDLKTAQNLVEEYMIANDGVALAAANALNGYMRELASRFLSCVDPRIFYAREFSIDITGEFDGTQRLRPVVGELQYPLGFMSYIPELSKTDSRGLNFIYETQRIMHEQDVTLIRQAITR